MGRLLEISECGRSFMGFPFVAAMGFPTLQRILFSSFEIHLIHFFWRAFILHM